MHLPFYTDSYKVVLKRGYTFNSSGFDFGLISTLSFNVCHVIAQDIFCTIIVLLNCSAGDTSDCVHLRCSNLVFFVADLSVAVQKFSQSLQEFQFECIGDAETDDEVNIGKCGVNR